MKKLLFIVPLIFSGCSQSSEKTGIPGETNDPGKTEYLIAANTKFKFLDKKVFRFNRAPEKDAVINASPDTLTAAQKTAWNYDLDFNSLSGLYYGATFYSKQNKVNEIQPIVIEGSSDDYSAYTLLCLDPEGKMISHIDLAGGLSAGPDSLYAVNEDSVILFTHDKFGNFLNDSEFCVNEVTYIDNIHNWTYTIDSIVKTYSIEPTGRILLKKTDSIRVLKKEIYTY